MALPSEGRQSASTTYDDTSTQTSDLLRALSSSRQFQRVYRAAIRGAVIGLLGRGGLHVVGSIVSTIRGRPARGAGFVAADTLRWCAFLGSFSGVFVSVDELLRIAIGEQRSARWRAGVAGAVAAPTMLLTGFNIRHDDLALYMLLRGVTLLVRCGNQASAPSWLRSLLAPTRWRHGDTALMCAATWQIIYSFVMIPESLPSSYVRFLNKMASMQSWLVPVAKELAIRNMATPHAAAPLRTLQGTSYAHLQDPSFCDVLHEGKGCNQHFVSVIPSLTQRSMSVYIPVYIASAVAVHRGALLRKPLPILAKMALGSMRSSCFLGVYVALAHRAICLAGQLPVAPLSKLTPAKMAMVAWLPGIATLIEKKSRRMELAFYCLGRAIVAFYKSLVVVKALPKWLLKVRTDVLVFAAAMGCIMHCYGDSHGEHRDIFRSKYLNVLDFLFGSRGLASGAVSHSISNRELFVAARHHTRVRLRTLSEGNLTLLGPRHDLVKVELCTAPESSQPDSERGPAES